MIPNQIYKTRFSQRSLAGIPVPVILPPPFPYM